MIRKTTRPVSAAPTRRRVTAGTSITSNARPRNAQSSITANVNLTAGQRAFVNQLQRNYRRMMPVNAATNTSNIMAKPAFMELLPIFVQKLIITDVFGTVAMNSRQQLIPYFKFIAENTKGETKSGDILASPFVNRQGVDPNFTGRVVKNETVGEGEYDAMFAQYTPILPGSVTVYKVESGVTTPYTDDGMGNLLDATGAKSGIVDYSNGNVTLNAAPGAGEGNKVTMTYQYDNETVGPDASGNYGAKMGKGYLQLDEINLVAEAHQIACYWSIYSAFAAQKEYGGNIGDMAKEAAFSELAAEINSAGFEALRKASSFMPQYNFDVAPVVNGSVVPSDYLNMFKLKLEQAAASIYQRTHLTRPNRLIVGTNVSAYMSMIEGYVSDNVEDSVGPYKAGRLNQFDVYVDPNQDPNLWTMSCKSADIRRNSALFGEYMPMMNTDQIGLANASVQQGYATMYGMKVVNPDTVVSGKIVGTF